METVNTRNNSVDLFRLICAIMVVAIHTAPFTDINNSLGYFATQVFPRMAVPFFFAVGGYYYVNALIAGKKAFWPYMKKLIIVYSLWSLIYFLIGYISFSKSGNAAIIIYVKRCIIDYFVYGSSYQLWFFPALFFAVVLTTIFYKIKAIGFLAVVSVILYIIGCLGCSYFQLGNSIPLLSVIINYQHFTLIRRVVLMGLPFFMLGYFLNMWKLKFIRFSNKKVWLFIITTGILFLLEILIITYFNLHKNIIITLVLYPLVAFVIILLLRSPLEQKNRMGEKARICANFMYYSHPIFILLITVVFNKLFSSPVTPTLLFFLTSALSIAGGHIIQLINKRWLNKFVLC